MPPVRSGRPRVTIVTVVRHPGLLDRCLASVLDQSYEQWNWVVVLSGGNRWQPAVDDPRIHLLHEDTLVRTGELKREACAGALGELIVDLDDDGTLPTNALELIVGAFDDDPTVGLVYGDIGHAFGSDLGAAGLPDAADGWTRKTSTFHGEHTVVVNSFEPAPHNVSHAPFTPTRGRAFRRVAYEASGGFDPTLDRLAEADLACRLFQSAGFLHLSECLYVERLDSQLLRAAHVEAEFLQEELDLYDRYIQPNALAWTHRGGLAALDLGAPDSTPPGYQSPSPKSGGSAESPWSMGLDVADSSAGVIRAVDVLPLVADKIALFNELYRVLAHGGILLSLTPSTDGRGAFQDPRHLSYYNEGSFWYFTDQSYSRFVPEIKCRFQLSRLFTFFPTAWHETNMIPYVCANLVAIKEGPRQGGRLNV